VRQTARESPYGGVSRKVLGQKKRRALAKKLSRLAKSKYGELKRRKIRLPLDQLALSILCRYTSTRRATRALSQFKRAFVDWNEVRISPVGEIAAALSGTEWAKLAAARIVEVTQALFEARNEVSLDFLEELTTTQARTFLQGLPGVTRDLADEVLLFSRRVSVLPLSAGAASICYRLGLIRTERPTLENQKSLMEIWPEEHYASVTLLLVDYAKSVCRSAGARCRECGMKSVCPKVDVE